MNEFELIKTIFAPLARHEGAFGLSDDAAVLSVPDGFELVMTNDVLVEGRHFAFNASADAIAKKALRTNLSDLAAMGAQPIGYLLGCQFNGGADEMWLKDFARGLSEDQSEFSISLLGGDTTRVGGDKAFSITAIGQVPCGSALRRKGAKDGDDVWVSGTIGDAFLGLQVQAHGFQPAQDDLTFLLQRLEVPEPRLALGQALRGLASAAIDVSDGLVADLAHIAEVSGVGIEITAEDVPLSEPARHALAGGAVRLTDLITGGDDYELAFTAPAASQKAVEAAAVSTGTPVKRIGRVTAGDSVVTVRQEGQPLDIERTGYTHF